LLALHGAAQFALDQGLDEQDQEVEVEQGLDTAFVLEAHRGDLEDGFALGEALLDGGLALVGLEDLGIGEGSIVAQERILRRAPDHAASDQHPVV
jgi:hypothetical protein